MTSPPLSPATAVHQSGYSNDQTDTVRSPDRSIFGSSREVNLMAHLWLQPVSLFAALYLAVVGTDQEPTVSPFGVEEYVKWYGDDFNQRGISEAEIWSRTERCRNAT